MDLQTFSLWIGIIGGLIGIITFARSELSGPGRKALAKIENVEERLTRAEARIEQMPTQNAMHLLELQISEMRGDIRELTAKLVPIGATMSRIQESLLERSK